ncbi:MAG: FHA domain-containing protein [Lachnospiraceae bacterium]|nr:FHA domain-containing protein [Lachnospiraceae bacterium]
MRMVKCFKGHMYNAEKFSSCPQCAAMEAEGQSINSQVDQADIDTEDPVTVKRQVYEIVGRRKVVGCLICVEGVMKGEGFLLVEGDNDIGRGANLEVVLSKETTVSRKAHACISYNPEDNSYILSAAKDKKDVIYDGNQVSEPVTIKDGKMLRIGQCELRFVAFCDEEFSWKD